MLFFVENQGDFSRGPDSTINGKILQTIKALISTIKALFLKSAFLPANGKFPIGGQGAIIEL